MSKSLKKISLGIASLVLICPLAMSGINNQFVSAKRRPKTNIVYKHNKHIKKNKRSRRMRRGGHTHKHLRRKIHDHKHIKARIKHHRNILRHHASMQTNLNSVNWYVNNAQKINKQLEKISSYSIGPANDYMDVRNGISGESFNADNIRKEPLMYHLGYVIGSVYGNNPYMNTHPVHSLSPKVLRHHKQDIAKAITNWKMIYKLVRRYPGSSEFSVGKNIANQEQASCVTGHGKTVYYINGHRMNKNDKKEIKKAIEDKNAYDDPDALFFE